MPDTLGINQLYTVLPGTMPLPGFVGVTTKVNPLHTVVLIGVTSGVGFTVTTKVNGDPSPQFPMLGVTI